MRKKEKYIESIENKIEKYKDKLSDVDKLMKSYKSNNKAQLEKERQNLKEKYKEAEAIFKKLKSSSQANFEDIKESSIYIFEDLKEAFEDFSDLLTLEKLYHVKDEVLDYGNEKVSEVQEYIKKKPLTCAALALGVGYLLGTLCKRSK